MPEKTFRIKIESFQLCGISNKNANAITCLLGLHITPCIWYNSHQSGPDCPVKSSMTLSSVMSKRTEFKTPEPAVKRYSGYFPPHLMKHHPVNTERFFEIFISVFNFSKCPNLGIKFLICGRPHIAWRNCAWNYAEIWHEYGIL